MNVLEIIAKHIDADALKKVTDELLTGVNANISEEKNKKSEVILVVGNDGSHIPASKVEQIKSENESLTNQITELNEAIKAGTGSSEEMKKKIEELKLEHEEKQKELKKDNDNFIKNTHLTNKLNDMGVEKGLNLILNSIDLDNIKLDAEGTPTNVDIVIDSLKQNEDIGFLLENKVGGNPGATPNNNDPSLKLNNIKSLEEKRKVALANKDAEGVMKINAEIANAKEE